MENYCGYNGNIMDGNMIGDSIMMGIIPLIAGMQSAAWIFHVEFQRPMLRLSRTHPIDS